MHTPQGFQAEITEQNCKVGREQLGHNKYSHVGKVSKWVYPSVFHCTLEMG